MRKLFIVIILGLFFIGLAFIYWTTPANALPPYLPGYSGTLSTIHFKHGLGSLLLGLGIFAYAWFASGKKELA